MYKAAITLLLTTMLFVGACTGNQKPGWQPDVQKSKVTWSTPKNMMGGHYGYFLFQSGNLEYSAAGEPVKGTFRMDMNSIHTTDHPTEAGNKKKEGEMRLPQFFDTDKHPVATMEVKKITRIDTSKNYHVAGDLTIKGITQPIAFTATIDTKGNTSHITATIDIAHILWEIGAKKHDQARLDSLSAVRESLVPYVHVLLDIGLRELCEGLLACEGKLTHLGLDKAPARSTISDANNNRSYQVFETIYYGLLKQYHSFISDSRLKGLSIRNLKVIDSSTIQLFSEILRGVGRNKLDGSRKKGGIKVHAMMDAFSLVLIRYALEGVSSCFCSNGVPCCTSLFLQVDGNMHFRLIK